MEPVKHIAQFIWMGWYIGGVAMGAFVWQSQSLGLVLGASVRRWDWVLPLC